MSPRPRATFAKRQKEQARQEKQRAKAERKQQRKLESQNPGAAMDSDIEPMSPDTSDTIAPDTEAVSEP